MPRSEAVEAAVRDKAQKLEAFYPAIIRLRVVLEQERLHHQQGQQFNVRIDLHVPGHEFATTREHHEDINVALRDAFDAAKRWLEDILRQQRGDVKVHVLPQLGRVTRVLQDQGYGFIEMPDGRELYFSAANVVTPPFERLDVGAEVQFIEDFGTEGRQAKRISIGHHRVA